MRTNSSITDHGEPSLLYLRRAHADSPAELVIVQDGMTHLYRVSDERLLHMIAEGATYLAARPKG